MNSNARVSIARAMSRPVGRPGLLRLALRPTLFSNFSRHPKPVLGKNSVGQAVWTGSGRLCRWRKPLLARPLGNSNRATAYEHETGHSETADLPQRSSWAKPGERRLTQRRPEPPASRIPPGFGLRQPSAAFQDAPRPLKPDSPLCVLCVLLWLGMVFIVTAHSLNLQP